MIKEILIKAILPVLVGFLLGYFVFGPLLKKIRRVNDSSTTQHLH